MIHNDLYVRRIFYLLLLIIFAYFGITKVDGGNEASIGISPKISQSILLYPSAYTYNCQLLMSENPRNLADPSKRRLNGTRSHKMDTLQDTPLPSSLGPIITDPTLKASSSSEQDDLNNNFMIIGKALSFNSDAIQALSYATRITNSAVSGLAHISKSISNGMSFSIRNQHSDTEFRLRWASAVSCSNTRVHDGFEQFPQVTPPPSKITNIIFDEEVAFVMSSESLYNPSEATFADAGGLFPNIAYKGRLKVVSSLGYSPQSISELVNASPADLLFILEGYTYPLNIPFTVDNIHQYQGAAGENFLATYSMVEQLYTAVLLDPSTGRSIGHYTDEDYNNKCPGNDRLCDSCRGWGDSVKAYQGPVRPYSRMLSAKDFSYRLYNYLHIFSDTPSTIDFHVLVTTTCKKSFKLFGCEQESGIPRDHEGNIMPGSCRLDLVAMLPSESLFHQDHPEIRIQHGNIVFNGDESQFLRKILASSIENMEWVRYASPLPPTLIQNVIPTREGKIIKTSFKSRYKLIECKFNSYESMQILRLNGSVYFMPYRGPESVLICPDNGGLWDLPYAAHITNTEGTGIEQSYGESASQLDELGMCLNGPQHMGGICSLLDRYYFLSNDYNKGILIPRQLVLIQPVSQESVREIISGLNIVNTTAIACTVEQFHREECCLNCTLTIQCSGFQCVQKLFDHGTLIDVFINGTYISPNGTTTIIVQNITYNLDDLSNDFANLSSQFDLLMPELQRSNELAQKAYNDAQLAKESIQDLRAITVKNTHLLSSIIESLNDFFGGDGPLGGFFDKLKDEIECVFSMSCILRTLKKVAAVMLVLLGALLLGYITWSIICWMISQRRRSNDRRKMEEEMTKERMRNVREGIQASMNYMGERLPDSGEYGWTREELEMAKNDSKHSKKAGDKSKGIPSETESNTSWKYDSPPIYKDEETNDHKEQSPSSEKGLSSGYGNTPRGSGDKSKDEKSEEARNSSREFIAQEKKKIAQEDKAGKSGKLFGLFKRKVSDPDLEKGGDDDDDLEEDGEFIVNPAVLAKYPHKVFDLIRGTKDEWVVTRSRPRDPVPNSREMLLVSDNMDLHHLRSSSIMPGTQIGSPPAPSAISAMVSSMAARLIVEFCVQSGNQFYLYNYAPIVLERLERESK